MSMVNDIADYLENNSIGIVDLDIFCSEMPSSPDNVIGVFQCDGRQSDIIAEINRPGLEIRVRDVDYTDAEAKIKDIEGLLMQIGDECNQTLNEGVVMNDSLYLRVIPEKNAYSLENDSQDRFLLVQKFNLDIRR